MTKAAEEYKFAIVMKFLQVRPSIDVIRLNVMKKVGERRKEVGKPKKNIIWQPKKFDIKGSSSGTKDDKEMEANIASLGERLQDSVVSSSNKPASAPGTSDLGVPLILGLGSHSHGLLSGIQDID
ncbi:hypothetical protein ACLOJK_023259 [Asimina triloba]